MERLFGRHEFGLAAAADVPIEKELGDDAARPAAVPDQKAEHLYAQYRKLRAILRAYRERITAAARARSVRPHPALSRSEMIASIEQLQKVMSDANSAPRLLTSYALNLLNAMVGKAPRLELQTIYNYVVGAGGTLPPVPM